MMRKFLLNLISFIAITLLLYIVLIIFSGRFLPRILTKNLMYKYGGHMQNRLREADTFKNTDILFIGSSHSYRGYDVRIFDSLGLKTFNLGSSAQTPMQTEYLLKKYAPKLNPKFVVLDVYPSLLGSDGLESTIDIVSNSKMDKSLFDYIVYINNIKVYNTAMYAYYAQLTGKNKHYKVKTDLGKGDTYISGGYVESAKVYTKNEQFDKRKYTVTPGQFKALQNTIVYLKQHNIPYILVQTPVPANKYASITNTRYIDSLLAGCGNYFNFNNIMTLPKQDFIDDSHLNKTGVAIFNKKLIDTMKAEGLFNKLIVKHAVK